MTALRKSFRPTLSDLAGALDLSEAAVSRAFRESSLNWRAVLG
jgi:DNA-binding Lrp family transcriptional regulator